ncbi:MULTISPECIES: hypothetical protein [unclassified Pseudomonas]|uniref:hypothetical protein n=1 Tax=unclassified Pseudomonas TaxID=196821 RepID=UPI00117A5FD8|nr:MULTISPECIES: hypothetical protein [unclassified Pseudomonas]
MRDRQAQILFFEKYGLMVDCSKLSERQIDRFLCIFPQPKLSNNETLGDLFTAAFGKGVHLPVATPEYQRLPSQTPVESVQCPSLYNGLVRQLRARWQKSENDLKAEKSHSHASLESLKAAHQLEIKKAEDAAYAKGLLDAEKVFKRKMLVEATAALEEVTEQLDSYTIGIRDDLDECIKTIESSPVDSSISVYNLIIEISKRFAKRVKRTRDLQSST